MKQIEGNRPTCWSCYYFREKTEGDNCRHDGWCVNPHQCSTGINGRKREKPLDREPVKTCWECRDWEDAEDRISHFDYCTGAYRNQKV